VSDESRAQETPDSPAQELTDDHIQRLLRNADRLAFGIRPAGFVLINRARLLAAHGITQTSARLIDRWVAEAGGGVQPLRRAEPEAKAVRKYHQRTKRPETMVWGIPAGALKQNAGASS
jgi:branched-subunit amino acid aminotransferase/4-amino-4-deoxychorismate lyase